MSKVIVLNDKFKKADEIELPKRYEEINSHNLYLYVKSYLAALRANTANTKSRSEVSGGGKKPWRQKGRGGARAGSIRSNIWVGGGVAFGPKNNKNYFQKVNKKQKRLAFEFALFEKAKEGKLFVVDSVKIKSGKTKDAANLIKKLNLRDALIVGNFSNEVDEQKFIDIEKTFLAYDNLKNCYCVDVTEMNAYLVSVFGAVIIEKSAFESIIKEG